MIEYTVLNTAVLAPMTWLNRSYDEHQSRNYGIPIVVTSESDTHRIGSLVSDKHHPSRSLTTSAWACAGSAHVIFALLLTVCLVIISRATFTPSISSDSGEIVQVLLPSAVERGAGKDCL